MRIFLWSILVNRIYTEAMEYLKKYWQRFLLGFLILSNLFVWVAFLASRPSNLLRVYFLDVGQGDAILIDSPTHGRILLDAGPNRQVLAEIGRILPFGDRRIDVLIESHPDRDHIGGMPDVVSRYNVGFFLEPGVESASGVDDELRERINNKNIKHLLARKGLSVDLGDGVKLVVLFPNQDVSGWETNDASIVAKLMYGEQSFLLTGESTKKAEYILLGMEPHMLNSTVLKAGHHGSRTSTSLPFAEAVSPEYAVISAGKDNSYGHPHQEVLDVLKKVGARVISTEDVAGLVGRGTIIFETDGKVLQLK
jgi:competence protein ComEC